MPYADPARRRLKDRTYYATHRLAILQKKQAKRHPRSAQLHLLMCPDRLLNQKPAAVLRWALVEHRLRMQPELSSP